MNFIHKIKERPFLFISIALLILLRTLFLTGDSLWIDETFSVINAQKPITVIVTEHLSGIEPNAPLYPLLLQIWMTLFGDSEAAVRSLSLLFSFMAAPALYKGSKNLLGKRAAEWTLFLYALSPPLIYFAQEVRAYGLFIMLLSFIFWAWSDFRKRGISPLNGVVATLSLWGMVLSHPYGWFVVGWTCFLYVVHLIISKRRPYLKEVISGAIALIPVVIYLAFFMTVVSKQQEGFWIKVPGLKHLLGGIHFQAGSFPLLAMYVIASLRWFFTKGFKEKQNEIIFSFLGFWGLFTIVPFVLSLFLTPIYTVRYTIFSALFMMLTAVVQLTRESKQVQIIFAVIISLFSIHHWGISKANATREQWQEITQTVHPSIPAIGGAAFIRDYPLAYYLPNREFSQDHYIVRETMDDKTWVPSLDSFLFEKDQIQLLTSHFGDGNTEKVLLYFKESGWKIDEEVEWFYRDQNNLQRSSAQWFLLKK